MIATGAAEMVYAAHVLEYLDRVEAVEALTEWARVLRPGGRLLLSVPDFAELASHYTKYRDLAALVGPLFGRMALKGEFVSHRTVYDYPHLAALLLALDYKKVRRVEWLPVEGIFDDHARAQLDGRSISINVEAQA
jgi:SAM-dependent methyltransferase